MTWCACFKFARKGSFHANLSGFDKKSTPTYVAHVGRHDRNERCAAVSDWRSVLFGRRRISRARRLLGVNASPTVKAGVRRRK